MKRWRSKAIVKVAVTSWGRWFSSWGYITIDLQEYFIKPRLPCQQIWLSYDGASERCWYHYPGISSWESLPQVVSRWTCQMTSLSAAEKIVSSILMGVWKASTASAASRGFVWVAVLAHRLHPSLQTVGRHNIVSLFWVHLWNGHQKKKR